MIPDGKNRGTAAPGWAPGMVTTTMIKCIWHGWTTYDNADRYDCRLKEKIFPGIAAKRIPGYREIQLLRREHDTEVEFTTMATIPRCLMCPPRPGRCSRGGTITPSTTR